MILTTEAIVLHARRHGDSSRIVTLYTRELGKVGVVAKGARTTKSAFGSAMEPLSHIRCTVYHRPMKDLHTVAKAELLHPMRRLGSHLELLRSGLLMCEYVMKTQKQTTSMRMRMPAMRRKKQYAKRRANDHGHD